VFLALTVVPAAVHLLIAGRDGRLWKAPLNDWLGRRMPRLGQALQHTESALVRGGPWLASAIGALVVWWILGAVWEPLGRRRACCATSCSSAW
jgi:hypothetical protein